MLEPNFICEYCGNSGYKCPSKLNKHLRNFCSRECSSSSQSKKQEVVCLNCDEKFFKSNAQIVSHPRNFCSRKCKSDYQVKKEEVVCLQCNKTFMKGFKYIKKSPNHFCSRSCAGIYHTKKQEVACTQCGKYIVKSAGAISRYSKSFCSKLCSADFRNTQCDVECLICKKNFKKNLCRTITNPRHCCSLVCFRVLQKYFKNWGSNRSKLEIEVEFALKKIFHFEILFNKKTIGYELDIDIPCLDLAIEINGPTHYKVIFDEEKLLRTQKLDKEKAAECLRLNKHLIVINVSEDKHLKRVRQQRINEIIEIINKKIAERNYKPEVKQLTMSF